MSATAKPETVAALFSQTHDGFNLTLPEIIDVLFGELCRTDDYGETPLPNRLKNVTDGIGLLKLKPNGSGFKGTEPQFDFYWQGPSTQRQALSALPRMFARLWRKFTLGGSDQNASHTLQAYKDYSRLVAGSAGYTVDLPDDPTTFRQAIDDGHCGRFRLVFPVVERDVYGRLLWVEVTVVPLDRLKKVIPNSEWPSLFALPWSSFIPDASDPSFRDLVDRLPKALGAPVKNSAEELVYCVSLDRLDQSDVHNAPDKLLELSPTGLEFEGPSLGLAVLLSAWAARRRLTLRPIIATGGVDPEGKRITEIAGITQKLEACKTFLSARQDSADWWICVPEKNKNEALTEMSKHSTVSLKPVVAVDNIVDFCADEMLTDGFDDFLEQVGREEAIALVWEAPYITTDSREVAS